VDAWRGKEHEDENPWSTIKKKAFGDYNLLRFFFLSATALMGAAAGADADLSFFA
jgi:hypothetical protein